MEQTQESNADAIVGVIASVEPTTQDVMDTCEHNADTQAQPQTLVMTTTVVTPASLQPAVELSGKPLKRCLSVPTIRMPTERAPWAAPDPSRGASSSSSRPMTLRSASAAAKAKVGATCMEQPLLRTPNKYQQQIPGDFLDNNNDRNAFIRSNPSSREQSPAPLFFAHRTRRYSSTSSTCGGNGNSTSLCLTPRVSQLRQEECSDVTTREINHERELRTTLQISQSYEDLTLSAEAWSCKTDDAVCGALRIATPPALPLCLSPSPSPTGHRASMRLPYSPSPKRGTTYATRRSMSPVPMRPSQLCAAVKRKFELDDSSASNWNICSQPPMKKMMTESRGSSPSPFPPTPHSASPDPCMHDGRATPKLFISKLCTTSTVNSECSSPVSAISSTLSSNSGESLLSSGSSNTDEGISMSDMELKLRSRSSSTISVTSCLAQQVQSTDISDDATLLDDVKSETSSVSGCSMLSYESSSLSSTTNEQKPGTTFLNRLASEDGQKSSSQKSFFINKQGLRGAKKFIVNHEDISSSNGGGGE